MSEEFGYRLTKLLSIRHLKQSDFARLIGKSSATVSSYCRGISEPSLDVLVKIANVLKVQWNSLLGEPYSLRGEALISKLWLFYVYDLLSEENKEKLLEYAFRLCPKDNKDEN